MPSPTLTEEDLQNLKIAKQCGVTGVMLPFVRGKADILALRHALEEAGAADIRIFAKIENMTGVRALPEFIHLVDEVVTPAETLAMPCRCGSCPAARSSFPPPAGLQACPLW